MNLKARFIDIGANLCDPMFKGVYNGKKYHAEDIKLVLNRAVNSGVDRIILTSGSLEDAAENVRLISELCQDPQFTGKLSTTCGIHPTMSSGFSNRPDDALQGIDQFIRENLQHIVAYGELGLDYDRFNYCKIDDQLLSFQKQLELAQQYDLPLFLHSRAAEEDFLKIITKFNKRPLGGVVHSFTGTADEAKKYMDLGFFIGINGCSLKCQSNIEVVKSIPESKILLETDAPWCGIRKTHASFEYVQRKFTEKKKSSWSSDHCVATRSEPCHIVSVAEVLCAIRNADFLQFSEKVYSNTMSLFSKL